MPLLFEHYQAHKTADKNLSVWSFFYEHYLNSSTNDPDYLADMQLPLNHTTSISKEDIIMGSDAKKMPAPFIEAIAQHRFWNRETVRKVLA